MRNAFVAAIAFAAVTAASFSGSVAQTSPNKPMIKTRLDHFRDTHWVLVVNYLPSEITSITCEKWVMLGVKSWKDQNNFTIPAGPAVAVMDANKFDGYCTGAGSIVAHTDDGDFTAVLDGGAGNWNGSTKLTIGTPAR